MSRRPSAFRPLVRPALRLLAAGSLIAIGCTVTAPESGPPSGQTPPPSGMTPPTGSPPPAPPMPPPPRRGSSMHPPAPPAPPTGMPPAPPAPPVGMPPGMMPPAAPPAATGPAPLPPNAKEGLPDKALVVYWGQNGTGGRNPGDRTHYEKELDETCEQNPHYDALVLGFVIIFGDTLNASGGAVPELLLPLRDALRRQEPDAAALPADRAGDHRLPAEAQEGAALAGRRLGRRTPSPATPTPRCSPR